MPRNGSTWPGALPSLKKFFRIPKPPHPSFGRFKRFLRRSSRRPARSPPLLATPEGDHPLTRHPSSVLSRHAVRNFGGPSTDTVDLGVRCLNDINTSLPFLDVPAANADMAVSADEYNTYQNHTSTSVVPPPLPSSPLSDKFPAIRESDETTSARLSGTDIVFQDSLLGTGSLSFAADPTPGSTSHAGPSSYPLLLGTEGPLVHADPTASTSQAGPFPHRFLSDVQHPNALGLYFADLSEEIDRPSHPRKRCLELPPLSPIPSAHDDELTNEEHDYETPYQIRIANDYKPTNESRQDTTSSNRSYHSAFESPSLQQERQPDTMVPRNSGNLLSLFFDGES